MREIRTAQASIFDTFCDHELGRELAAMSRWLDEHAQVCEWVADDLRAHGVRATGRKGTSAEAALRCALLKQHRQLSYEELSFHLLDSASFRAFARLAPNAAPTRSSLQHLVGSITAGTWERINAVLRDSARRQRLDSGRRIRIDSTVTDAPIHAPSDSTLLWDATRVMVRLLEQAQALCGRARIEWVNHTRAAKKHARRIEYVRGQANKAKLYRKLLVLVRNTLAYAQRARTEVSASGTLTAPVWLADFERYEPLIERIMWQTTQRVVHGHSVASADKLVSLFEPHTDIIVKSNRETLYGHKLNLVSGRSGLILDAL